MERESWKPCWLEDFLAWVWMRSPREVAAPSVSWAWMAIFFQTPLRPLEDPTVWDWIACSGYRKCSYAREAGERTASIRGRQRRSGVMLTGVAIVRGEVEGF